MANQKQDGSNCINSEYSTGACKTRCEQCFVNWGQQGLATCKAVVNPGHANQLQFAKDGGPPAYAARIAADQGALAAYNPPPIIPPGKRLPPGREWLIAEITKDRSNGFVNVPTKSSWVDWAIKRHRAQCESFNEAEGAEQLGVLPFFLRVSSMSDSAWAPATWLRLVRDAWEEKCFFNSSINTLRKVKGTPRATLFDEYHALVVTMNPGFQKLPPFRPQSHRALLKAERTAEREAWSRKHWRMLSPLDQMGTAGQTVKGDFLHPYSCTDIGLAHLERVIKFYRLRALPTIRGRFVGDTPPNAPLVITQMRFKGLDHALEFVRRYDLHAEVRLPRDRFYKKNVKKLKAASLPKSVVKQFRKYFKLIVDADLERPELHIWTDENDSRNGSPYAGQRSIYVFESSYWRPVNSEYFNDDAYVCDRIHGGCAHCGLCASLDGRGPTVGDVSFWNPENKTEGGGKMLPYPGIEGAGYIGSVGRQRWTTDNHGDRVLVPPGADFFAERMQALGVPLDTPLVAEKLGWVANPRRPADPDECVSIFGNVARYVNKREFFVEGWNTHENAAAATAYGVWSLMVYAAQTGIPDDELFLFVMNNVEAGAGDTPILDGVDDLWSMWDGYSPWLDQFGLIHERED
jgi:hypothetical protein